MRFWIAFLPLFAIATLPRSARAAEDGFFERVTVTATGTETSTSEVPVSVTVIDREEIEDSQAETLADLIRRSPGVTVLRSGDEGKITSVFTRGTEASHTLVLFDGVRLNSPYFGGYSWRQLSTSGLERIEVARGPFSALWGADAVGGVVNLVPRRMGRGLEGSVTGEGGQDDWRRLEGAVAWANDRFDVQASGFDRRGAGAAANDDFRTRQGLVDAGWSWGEGDRVALLIQNVASETGIPFYDPRTPSPRRRQEADQRLVAVPLRVRVKEGWDLDLSTSRVERDLRFHDPDDPGGFTESRTVADTVQTRLASRHTLGAHGLTWGAEWRRDEVDDRSNFGVNLEASASDVRSLFAQDEWRRGDVRLVLGARWDGTDEWGSEVSPRIDVGWRAGRGFDLRAGYGQAFREPSVGELYFPFSGNPALEPETSESYEAGLAWTGERGKTRFELAAFATDVTDLIDYDFATLAFRNTGEARIRGAELSFDRQWGGGPVSMVQLTWLDTEDAAGDPLLRRPRWSGSLAITGRLLARLRGDATLLWVGPRDDLDPIAFTRTELGGHAVVHLAAAWALRDGWEITARAVNAGNRAYEEVAGYPAPGRRLTAGMRWRL